MNKVLLSILLAGTTLAQAQTTFNDTVSLSSSYKDAVYYKLSDGSQSSVLNTDWHLAFSVQKVQFPYNTLQAVTLRYNGGGNLIVSQKAFNDTAFFTGDTVGYSTFTKLYDSDSDIDTGAFNNGLNISQFDYGWGVYNTTTKNIHGRNIFYIQLASGIKKFRVVDLAFDTIWQVQYANLDNSNLQTVSIPKRPYLGKLFAYLNLETNAVTDREPNAANWDLLFHKYAALDVPGIEVYPSTGVWSNKGVTVAKAYPVDVTSNDYSGFTFSKSLRGIGRDWKDYVAPNWIVADSVSYFVKTKDNAIYKLVFTGFKGSATGNIFFSKTTVQTPTAIGEVSNLKIACYPNPASSTLTVIADNLNNNAIFSLTDISGKQVLFSQLNETGFKAFQFDVSNLANGLYIATLNQNGNKVQQRIVVNK